MQTICRIGTVKRIDEKSRLHQVERTLTNNDDLGLCILTDYIRKQTEGCTGWNQLDQTIIAEEIIEREILSSSADNLRTSSSLQSHWFDNTYSVAHGNLGRQF